MLIDNVAWRTCLVFTPSYLSLVLIASTHEGLPG